MEAINLPKIYGLYKSPLTNVSLRLIVVLLFWPFRSMSVRISGKHCKMLCRDDGDSVSIVLLLVSLTLMQMVGIGHLSVADTADRFAVGV